jgi:transcriptional antiterminator Rof (Rho-off)
MTDNQNITFFLHENEATENSNTEFSINDILQEIDNSDYDELKLPQIIHYTENFTVKELLLICEYYGFAKELKTKKYNKEEIIHILIEYEFDPLNQPIVSKRQNMWFYMNELKNDKFMKKYLLWS